MSYRGVNLLVVGNPVYMKYAANMIVSIKAYSPDIPVNLIAEKRLIAYLPQYYHLWDIFTEIDRKDCYDEGVKLNPGRAKLNLYPYLWKNNNWTECIYLDVDGLVIRDVDKLFDFDANTFFKCQKDAMHWAKDDVIREHFKLPEKAEIHGLNSSYMFVRKCPQAKAIFDYSIEAMKNPLPVSKMENNWFNNQPDELYFSIGMSKAGITDPYPSFSKYPVYFRTRHSYGSVSFNEEIQPKHFVIGCYGGERYNHKSVGMLYDKLAMRNAQKVMKQHNLFKYHILMEQKHKY